MAEGIGRHQEIVEHKTRSDDATKTKLWSNRPAVTEEEKKILFGQIANTEP